VRSKADEMASLIQRTAQKRKTKEKIKTKPSSYESGRNEYLVDAVNVDHC